LRNDTRNNTWCMLLVQQPIGIAPPNDIHECFVGSQVSGFIQYGISATPFACRFTCGAAPRSSEDHRIFKADLTGETSC
jgi:hypothetical protein